MLGDPIFVGSQANHSLKKALYRLLLAAGVADLSGSRSVVLPTEPRRTGPVAGSGRIAGRSSRTAKAIVMQQSSPRWTHPLPHCRSDRAGGVGYVVAMAAKFSLDSRTQAGSSQVRHWPVLVGHGLTSGIIAKGYDFVQLDSRRTQVCLTTMSVIMSAARSP
jgi:hypothetical protein